jgi:putative transposase
MHERIEFLVTRETQNKAKRGPIRPKPHVEYPNHLWGIDMTKIKMASWGWLYLTVVLDWHTKEIIGYNLGLQSRTEGWPKALYQAVNNRFLKGIRESMKEQ